MTQPKNKQSRSQYPNLTADQIIEIEKSAPKPRSRARVKSQLFPHTPEQPGTQTGLYSVRTRHANGDIDFEIDWRKLQEHMKTV